MVFPYDLDSWVDLATILGDMPRSPNQGGGWTLAGDTLPCWSPQDLLPLLAQLPVGTRLALAAS